MRKPYVLIVVPFKGQTELLKNCVNSILESYVSGIVFSIVLWDDGTDDTELDNLYRSIYREIVIYKHDNVGYTQAVYNIFNHVKNSKDVDYLLLCNSDIKLRKGAFHALVKRMMCNENYAAVGGKILKYNSDEIIHTGTIIKNNKICDPYCGLHCDDEQTNNVEKRLWVNGCCTLYNMDIIKKYDLNFDIENFSPAYFEEADLMTRLNYLGHPVMYEPRAEIEHVVNATFSTERNKYESIFWKNWNKYLELWNDKFNHPMLNVFV